MRKLLMITAILILTLVFVQNVSAGSVEDNFVPPNVCRGQSDIFIGFEDGTDQAPVTNQYPGVLFSLPGGQGNWIYGDVSTGEWSYPTYYCDGDFWVIPDVFNPPFSNTGRIDFTEGTASYVSVLVSGFYPVQMEAYDSSNNLIDESGFSANNLNTNTMTRLTVEGSGIAYVLIHDSNDFWVMDDLCTDAPTGLEPVPEFPSIAVSIGAIVGILFAVAMIKRKES